MFQSAGNNRLSFLAVRGGETNFTLVLIDGVEVNDPTNSRGGGFDFSQLDVNIIEQVSVYTGDVSAIYGGSAMNGVVSITTLGTNYSGMTFQAGGDSDYRAQLTGSLDTATQSGLFSIGVSDRGDGTPGTSENMQALAKHELELTNGGLNSLSIYSETDSSGFPEDSGGAKFAVNRQLEEGDSDLLIAGVTLDLDLARNVAFLTTIGWSRHREFIRSPGIAEGFIDGIPPSEIDSRYENLTIDSHIEVGDPGRRLIAGLSYEMADGENEGYLDFGFQLPASFSLSQDVASGFLEYRQEVGAWSVGLGLRYDKPDRFDSELSARLSSDFRLAENWSWHLNWSEGYKLPSFFALAHPLIGNSQLKPEQSTSVSTGLSFQHPARPLRFSLQYFENEYIDLVDFDPQLFTSVNRSRVESNGLELAMVFALSEELSLSASSSYVDTDVIGESAVLRRRPSLESSLRLSYDPAGPWSAHMRYQNMGRFDDSSIPTGMISLSSYNRAGLTVSREVSSRTRVQLSLDNLGDSRYQNSVGFVEPGLQARVAITMALSR